MAKSEEYLTYEQVLQELQINRSQLNQLIREGRLREHLMDGETKFRLVEARDVRKALGKRPTVVEEGESGEEPTTDVLEDQAAARAREPKTEVIGADEGERATELLEGKESVTARSVGERDTEIIEEAPVGEELELEAAPAEKARKPLAEEPPASRTALETELELKTPAAAAAKPEEDFFDFTGDEELELEEAAAEKPKAAAKPAEEDEEMVTDILNLGAEEEVPEEDLLSEIMDIDEEQAAAKRAAGESEDTKEITAEITTLEEPTFEESGLGEVVEGAPAVEFEEEAAGPEFELPYAEPVAAAEAQVGLLPVVLLAVSVVVMLLTGIVLIENAMSPDLSTHLLSWLPLGR
jgi:hypothetical protein